MHLPQPEDPECFHLEPTNGRQGTSPRQSSGSTSGKTRLQRTASVQSSTSTTSVQSSKAKESTRLIGKATTRKAERRRIRTARGAFKFLPVYTENDLVHGSWWMVWGSLLGVFICVIPLMDLYLHFFVLPVNTSLAAFSSSITWIMCIISSVFFTLGSWIFVRAFKDPAPPPLFGNWYHLQTDELLGAWVFLLAMLPMIPYSIEYIRNYPTQVVYWGMLIMSVIFTAGSAFFVYCCYPSVQQLQRHETEIVLPIFVRIFGPRSWTLKHVQTDWLAACWFCVYGCLLWAIGSWYFCIIAENGRQIFVWVSSLVDAVLFLIGTAYYVAGSYPMHKEIDHDAAVAADPNNEDDNSMFAWTQGDDALNTENETALEQVVLNILQDQQQQALQSQTPSQQSMWSPIVYNPLSTQKPQQSGKRRPSIENEVEGMDAL